tara:strand:- start:446 stop:895 length:450 start_codon:yes stop_codon:yes gene_type:complete
MKKELMLFVLAVYVIGILGSVSASGIGGGLGIQLEVTSSDDNGGDDDPVDSNDEDDDEDDDSGEDDENEDEDDFSVSSDGDGSVILREESLNIYESNVAETKIVLNRNLVGEEEIDPKIILGFAIVDIVALIFFIIVMVKFLKAEEKRN